MITKSEVKPIVLTIVGTVAAAYVVKFLKGRKLL